jgi:hypothetical protein
LSVEDSNVQQLVADLLEFLNVVFLFWLGTLGILCLLVVLSLFSREEFFSFEDSLVSLLNGFFYIFQCANDGVLDGLHFVLLDLFKI